MATGRYYRITPRFWLDPDIRNEWTEDMRLLALYLLTSPHRNMVGLFHCPPSYAINDLQWNEKRFRNGFEALLQASFIQYDEASQVVLIPNAVRYDPPSNDNQVTGSLNALASVPETFLLLALADACDNAAAKLEDEKAADRCRALAERIRNRYMNRFETVPKPSRTTVPVPVPDTENIPPPVEPDGSGVSDNGKESRTQSTYPDDFLEFWAVYPRKVEKGKALKAWRARLRERLEDGQAITPEVLQRAAAHYANHCKHNGTEQRYIKHPASFLSKDQPFAEYLVPGNARAPTPPAPAADGFAKAKAWYEACYGKPMPEGVPQ